MKIRKGMRLGKKRGKGKRGWTEKRKIRRGGKEKDERYERLERKLGKV